MTTHERLVEALQQAEKITNEFYALKPTVKKNFHSMNIVECAMKVIRALEQESSREQS